MMRDRASLAVLLMVAVLGVSTPAVAQSTAVSVYVNGAVVPGVQPLIREGIAYLPADSLAVALGVSIGWDSSLNIIKVNNQVIAATPLDHGGTLMIPVEAMAQAIGGTVEWDGHAHAIRIMRSSVAASNPVQPYAVQPYGLPLNPTPAQTPSYSSVPTVVVPAPVGVTSSPVVAGVNPVSVTTTAVPPVTQPWGATAAPSYPSPSAYPPSPASLPVNSPTIQPPSAPPVMPSGLNLPPAGTENGPPITGVTPGAGTVYVPKTAQNSVFAVTVTNIERVGTIKDYYHPRPGYQFVIVYLSQQNVSNEVQIYTGRFSLLDQNNNAYDYIEGLSNFWLVILRPYGINFGYLVFEIPTNAHPTRLALHALNQSPLTMNL